MIVPQLFRIESPLPARAFRTYALRQPLATHWRVCTCAEVDCPRYLEGWKTPLDLSTQDGQNAAAWIRQSGLRFTEEVDGSAHVTFRFPPGQLCPRSTPGHPRRHRAPLGRPPVMLRFNGDHRQQIGSTVLHGRAEDWRDDFGEHLDRLHDQKQKG